MKFVSRNYGETGRGGRHGWFRGIEVAGRRTGFDRSTLHIGDEKYMDRWILYVWGYTLRLHKFYRGDDNRASHTHPWWFVTFPLATYCEQRARQGTREPHWHIVKAFRFHYRPADFEHFVISGITETRSNYWQGHLRPFYTIVLTGPMRSSWGFYPEPGKFINWADWK
jgi:hypothetical protein